MQVLGCGTSSGVPLPGCKCEVCVSTNPRNKRNRASVLIKDNSTGYAILIDATPDFRYQCLQRDVQSIDAVLFTHTHADHVFGIDDLRCFNFIGKRSIPCYGTKVTTNSLAKQFSYIFNPEIKYLGGARPKLTLTTIPDLGAFKVGEFPLNCFPLEHGTMPVTGYRIGDLGYLTDCKVIPNESRAALKGLNTLILDGCKLNETHNTHLTIPEAIQTASEIGAKKTYLTHMSHCIEYDEVSKSLPDSVELLYDGLELPVLMQ